MEVAIVAAQRTAVGSFGGSLAKIPAPELGATVIKALLEKTGVKPEDVSEVILGQVLTAGSGQNPARQALIKAGLPVTTPATTLNVVCGSGLRAVHLAAQAILAGDSEIVIAGGQEKHVAVAAHPAGLPRRFPHGQRPAGGHHGQRRPDRRLQRLPHGHHRRERGRQVRHRPRRAGRLRAAIAAARRGRAESRQVPGRDRPGAGAAAQGRPAGLRRRRVHQA